MAVIEIISRNFENEVIFSDRPLLIEFWRVNSPESEALAPILEEVAEENLDIKVCSIDVDTEASLAARFDISCTPTLIVFRNRRITAQKVGVPSKREILEMLKT